MGKIRSVRFNFIMNVILTASAFIFPLITFPYASRILLPDGVGRVNFAWSFAYYFSMVAMLGVPTYGIRAVAKVRDNKEELSRTVQEILIINAVVGAFCYAAYFLAIWFVPRLRSDYTLFAIMSVTILLNVIGVEWMYRGLEQYAYIAVRSILFKVIAVVVLFLFVKDQSNYVMYGVVMIVSGVGSNILNFINLRRCITLRPVGHYNFRRHWKPIAIFFLMSIATTIYTNLDTVMLGFMKDDTVVGYYTAAVRVKTILVSFVTSLSVVLLPRVSYFLEQGIKEEFYRYAKKALNFVFLAALPITIYFILYSQETILLLSGDAFAPAVIPMQVIMPTVLLIGLTNVLGIQVLVPLDRERQVCYSVIAGAVTDCVINIIAIPRIGATGAALGTLVAEAVVLIFQLGFLWKDRGNLFSGIQAWKIVIATAAASVVCWFVKYLDLRVFPALVVSVVIFLIVYVALLLLTRESLSLEFLGQLRKRRQKE
ncbi:MAG: flippase [Bacteroidales bacterium]|nr:flippase [Bacteroidales bacterium]